MNIQSLGSIYPNYSLQAEPEAALHATALMAAAGLGLSDALLQLLVRKIDPHKVDPLGLNALDYAEFCEKKECADILRALGVRRSPEACLKTTLGFSPDGDYHDGFCRNKSHCIQQLRSLRISVILELVDAGASINTRLDKEGRTPLIRAVEGGDPEAVRTFLELGADPNIAKFDRSASAYSDGKSAIHLAAQKKNIHILYELLEAGAEVEARDSYMRTPLMLAAEEGWAAGVAMLLESDADVHAEDKDGRSCLFYAENLNREFEPASLNCIVRLVNAGADIYHFDKDRFTPFLYALKYLNYRAAQTFAFLGAGRKLRYSGDPSPPIRAAWLSIREFKYDRNEKIDLIRTLACSLFQKQADHPIFDMNDRTTHIEMDGLTARLLQDIDEIPFTWRKAARQVSNEEVAAFRKDFEEKQKRILALGLRAYPLFEESDYVYDGYIEGKKPNPPKTSILNDLLEIMDKSESCETVIFHNDREDL